MNELKSSILSGDKCPYCKYPLEKYTAISRLDDETKICAMCGQIEAMIQSNSTVVKQDDDEPRWDLNRLIQFSITHDLFFEVSFMGDEMSVLVHDWSEPRLEVYSKRCPDIDILIDRCMQEIIKPPSQPT